MVAFRWMALLTMAHTLTGASASSSGGVPSAAPTAAPTSSPTSLLEATAATHQLGSGEYSIQLLPASGVDFDSLPAAVNEGIVQAVRILETIIAADAPDVPAFADLVAGDPDVAADLCAYNNLGLADCAAWIAEALANGDALTWWANDPTAPAFGGPVDDLVVAVFLLPATPENEGKLATASYTFRRPGTLEDPSRLPIAGSLNLGAELFNRTADQVARTVVHELLHALGLGLAWPTPAGCGPAAAVCAPLAGTGALLPYDVSGQCKAAVEFAALCAELPACAAANPDGILYIHTTSPGAGSSCAHWSEAQLQDELMTADSDSAAEGRRGGSGDPASRVTFAALEDLGYQVNYDVAEGLWPAFIDQKNPQRHTRHRRNLRAQAPQ